MKKIIYTFLAASVFMGVGTTAIAVPDGLSPNVDEATAFNKMGSTVLSYIQWFGYAVAIGMILYVGIKYMMASASDKADLKKASINYVIGAIVVASATAIVSALASIGGSF